MIVTRMVSLLSMAVVCMLAGFTPVGAQDQPAPAGLESPQSYFSRMADFVSGARQFQVSLKIGYEVVQASGQKIAFRERRRITLARPDHLRVEIEKSSGEQGMVLFDGHKITVHNETHRVYAVAEKPGRIEDALVYFLKDLKMRMPLALMLSTNFPEEMAKRLVDLAFVEVDVTTEPPWVHLAGRTDQVDFQIWIPRSGNPLPRRIIITYRDEEGQPSFWADFSDWNLAPSISGQVFVFSPPAGTERIPFLAEMKAGATDETQKGGD